MGNLTRYGDDALPVVLVCAIGLVIGLPWWRQVIFDVLLWLFYRVLTGY